jgi:D-alanine---D-serine ligase
MVITMKRVRVAVLFGGCSTEHEVSLQSAYSVIANLDREKYDVYMLGITFDGRWILYTGNTEKIRDGSWYMDDAHCSRAVISPDRGEHVLYAFHGSQASEMKIDIVFPVLHGKNGEDGTVQGLCELAGLPVAGCGSAASSLCMDKDRAHMLVSLQGIRTPKAVCFDCVPEEDELLVQTRQLGLPLFVKPVKSGSSFGITKVYQWEELYPSVKSAFLYDDTVVIEENIEGFEVGCAVLGNRELLVGGPDEIELANGFFNYAEKYTLSTSKIHMPARLDEKTAERVREAAAVIYRTLGCRGLSRVDMFLTPEKEIVFNEVNTIPGFTAHSRYPNMMKGLGLAFPTLLDRLVELGLER